MNDVDNIYDFNHVTEDDEDLGETERSFTRERNFETKQSFVKGASGKREPSSGSGSHGTVHMGGINLDVNGVQMAEDPTNPSKDRMRARSTS
jgi:hypothetical protein